MKLTVLLSKGISGRLAFILLTLIVIIHITISYVFISENQTVLQRADRDDMIQKIINTIHLVQATSSLNRAHAVSAMEDPQLQVSLTPKPQGKTTFKEISFWEISKSLRNHYDAFSISIQMEEDQWLNINANVYSHFLLMQILLITLEIIVFGAILFAAWSINRFTRPLKNFKRAAEQFGVDIHSKPIAIYGPGIVRETAEAMNTMQQSIRELVRGRTQMLAAISHDLRTPITRMKLRTQFIEDPELVEKLVRDLDEMESMISQTLSFAKADNSTEPKVNIDLCSLLGTICDNAVDMDQMVAFHCQEHHIPFYARPIALKRAFTNLINNAIKYGHSAEVTLSHTAKTITITIEDNGPGIAEDELDLVLQPYYRADRSRSKYTGGVGLGLAVTRDIITDHNGDIKLQNRPEGGLSVSIKFTCQPTS